MQWIWVPRMEGRSFRRLHGAESFVSLGHFARFLAVQSEQLGSFHDPFLVDGAVTHTI